jgi:uncharacterized protein YuzE
MKIRYDKEVDAAYIYLKKIRKGEVAKAISLNENIIVDLDKKGRFLGVEILNASKSLAKPILSSLKK